MKSKDKGGAPYGNRNAYKHGFYAKNFSSEERRSLNYKPNLESELKASRVIANRILKRITSNGLGPEDAGSVDEKTMHAINSLAMIFGIISNLAKSHQLVAGKFEPVETAIMEALNEINVEDGYDKI
jgi:hypothetical protein